MLPPPHPLAPSVLTTAPVPRRALDRPTDVSWLDANTLADFAARTPVAVRTLPVMADTTLEEVLRVWIQHAPPGDPLYYWRVVLGADRSLTNPWWRELSLALGHDWNERLRSMGGTYTGEATQGMSRPNLHGAFDAEMADRLVADGAHPAEGASPDGTLREVWTVFGWQRSRLEDLSAAVRRHLLSVWWPSHLQHLLIAPVETATQSAPTSELLDSLTHWTNTETLAVILNGLHHLHPAAAEVLAWHLVTHVDPAAPRRQHTDATALRTVAARALRPLCLDDDRTAALHGFATIYRVWLRGPEMLPLLARVCALVSSSAAHGLLVEWQASTPSFATDPALRAEAGALFLRSPHASVRLLAFGWLGPDTPEPSAEVSAATKVLHAVPHPRGRLGR